MSQTFEKNFMRPPIDQNTVAACWHDEGFSFDIFRDPPGQEWNNFVHQTDEYVLVAQGCLSIEVGDEVADCEPGDLVRIPRGAVHSLKTISSGGSVWYYGYGYWGEDH